ncbi:FKBP-type peptidyl-prolyl cis-trans isomerase N-terminal domain-containing protein [Serratia sp. UGAL515B_01]|uniref:FKBP-type peptidyl-prolyl cis-trans isomerase N-terminal domain-containing protein n=1 Tax=Serratia sp. UGAL515B_01 TaxID=2986763 RepID=UPI002952C235|nr:FKBP-type peptidyl-prolyl cis-trans isomerase N-terminal domain-containing protein [Serratia sp. UGAL515B_01]WON77980.1 FKBP-type peptidyl-prolyl cis-trans isomerase [Serratia sp. UGAL515B_01]
MKSTLESLNAITNEVDEAPALLLLTPSQLDAVRPSVEQEVAKPAKRSSGKKPSESSPVPVTELKKLQAKINQLNTTVSLQEQELKQLRKTVQQDAKTRTEADRLKQNLQENLKSTEQMQRELAALKEKNSKNSGQLQTELDKSQQQSALLQKQLDALAQSYNENTQKSKELLVELDESRKKAQETEKALAQLTKQANEKEQKTLMLQKQLDALAVTHTGKNSERDALSEQVTQSKKQSEALQQQLALLTKEKTEKDQQLVAIKQQLDTLQLSDSEKAKSTQALQSALDESRKQSMELQNQLIALKEKAGEQQAENGALQQQLATLQKAVVEPKTEREIRDYAIGSSLAEDMLALLKEKAENGIEVDNRLALAGVQDTFAGKSKLPHEQLDKALDATEAAVITNEKQRKLKIEAEGSRYVEQFKKQNQVKKDAIGYFYRIDKLGKGKIEDNSIVTVVVKESLVNGKVIKDMGAAGTSIKQPLSSYPPMFRSALSKLQNNGSMTMVVPPNLAYGDKGLPPDIPPGSTMVYNVKILNVMAPADAAASVR